MPKKKEDSRIDDLEKKVESMNLVLHELVSFVSEVRRRMIVGRSGGLV